MKSLSHVWLFVTPWTIAYQAPPSMGFPGKSTGVGCHFLPQCMKVKSKSEVVQRARLLATPWTAAYQAPPSMGFPDKSTDVGCNCFLCHDPADVGNLIPGSSAFAKTSLNIWKFTVHILENFEHYFTSVWDECNCVVWAFFGIAFVWNWNENRPFPVLWPLLSFPNLLA